MLNKCYVSIKKIMLNPLFNKFGCRYLEHLKKHAFQKLNYQNTKNITIKFGINFTSVT